MRGIVRTDKGIMIGAMLFPNRKKPSLVVKEGNVIKEYAKFNDVEYAELFIDKLQIFTDAIDDEGEERGGIMTYEEAMKGISVAKDKYGEYGREWVEITEAEAEVAIDALEKIERIEDWIGTEEAITISELVDRHGVKAVAYACEKQIPKKPNMILHDGENDWYVCPACGVALAYNSHHCRCGQSIDWRK